jgi:hypothetical protein
VRGATQAGCAAVDEREACVVADCDAQRLRLRKITPPRIISVLRRARERPLPDAAPPS